MGLASAASVARSMTRPASGPAYPIIHDISAFARTRVAVSDLDAHDGPRAAWRLATGIGSEDPTDGVLNVSCVRAGPEAAVRGRSRRVPRRRWSPRSQPRADEAGARFRSRDLRSHHRAERRSR